MRDSKFEVRVIGPQEWDVLDDNIDVEVRFTDGRRYTATFFTLRNIASLFEKNRETGECSNGTYLWASEMILVETLDVSTLVSTVNGLLRDQEFEAAFTRVSKTGAIEA